MNEDILSKVIKPARYSGGEMNMVIKDKRAVSMRVAFCFPDTYEIGMSHLGLGILYGVMNGMDCVWCERAFAVWTDAEKLLRETKTPLTALESGDGLAVFDVLAFTLQYELCYTNVLNMLDLAGLPVRREERDERHPLVIAGGPCAYNPEPMADFIDLFVIGDGEEVVVELLGLLDKAKKSGATRGEILREAAQLQGVYIPALYDVSFNGGSFAGITPHDGAPEVVYKRIVEDIDKAYYPTKPLVPNTEIVHERVMLELFRGCIRGCRFCQAGYVTRPVRLKSVDTLLRQGMESSQSSGYEEIALTSLSTSDYPYLNELCDGLLQFCEPKRIGLSLPSLRADSFSRELMERVQKVRKSGLTFAPEAGTARLRDVINKNLTEQDLMNACKTAFEGGWSGVKLYFMTGLPTETDEDLLGIAELCSKVYQIWRGVSPDRSRGVRITASTALFVPKPHTPFQWEPQDTREELARKTELIKRAMRKQVSYSWHDPDTSFLEGVLARGDRRVGAVILAAWRLGARLDGWRESFRLDIWEQAFREEKIDPLYYSSRRRSPDEPLPWGHISAGVSLDYLKREAERAKNAEPTPDCRQACSACVDPASRGSKKSVKSQDAFQCPWLG